MKLIAYLEELKQIPVLSWSFLAISQTIKQDNKGELLKDLGTYLPLDFKGSVDEALFEILSHEFFQNSSKWSIHKKRLLLGINQGIIVAVPKAFEERKQILLSFNKGKIAEQKRIQENLFKFSEFPPLGDDEDVPF